MLKTEKPVTLQEWDNLLFIHWEYDSKLLQALLPEGIYVDTFEGKAYITIVPLNIKNLRPSFCKKYPCLNFYELNLRTYVKTSNNEKGIWFFSLDAESLLVTLGGRFFFKLPYIHSRFETTKTDEKMTCLLKRGDKKSFYSYSPYGIPKQSEKDSLDHFLVERYLFFSGNSKRLYSCRVSHKPYLIQPVKHLDYDTNVISWDGLDVKTAPTLCHYSKGVEVTTFPIKRLNF